MKFIIKYSDKNNNRVVSTNSEVVANLFIKELNKNKKTTLLEVKVDA